MSHIRSGDSLSVEAALKELAQTAKKYDHGTFEFPFGCLDYVDPVTLNIEYLEIFRDGIYDFATDSVEPYIIDCGANIGLSVIRTKLCHPESRILAFEADPHICDVLQANIARLGLQGIDVICAAVSDTDGSAMFFTEGSEGGRLTAAGNIRVPTVRLSQYLDRTIDMLKIDIEGSEWEVLLEIVNTGALDNVMRIIIEFHGRRQNAATLAVIISGLVANGFCMTFPWSFCEPGLAGPREQTPFRYATDGKFIMFLHAWKETTHP